MNLIGASIRPALLPLLFFGATVGASCRYPTPDGDGPKPSSPNLIGVVIAVSTAQMTVQTRRNVRTTIKNPVPAVVYSAFGGDDRIENVKNGVVTRIWFRSCREPARGLMPEAGYVEICANDALDRPPPDYWLKH